MPNSKSSIHFAGAPASSLTIAGTGICQDYQGRYSLHDLHRAAGGEARHLPSSFLRLEATTALYAGIDRYSQAMSDQTANVGMSPGPYVAKELAFAYAMWISSAFHLEVIRAHDRSMAGAPPDLSNPAALRTLLLGYTERVLALEAAAVAQAPKVAFANAVGNASNTQTISQVAKALGVGPRKLFDFLRTSGILLMNNLPAQHHLACGRFRVIEVPFKDRGGIDRIKLQTRVTGKGVTFIQQRLLKVGGNDVQSTQFASLTGRNQNHHVRHHHS